MMNYKLSDLVGLKQGGVYCVVDEELKYVQIFASRNMMEHLSNLVKKVYTGEYGVLKDSVYRVEVKVLELNEDEESLKVIQSSWISKYRNDGYKFYRTNNLVSYKVKDDFGEISGKMYYLVYLENKRKDKVIVGVFNSKSEAITWKSLVYPNDIVDNLVFCQNEYHNLIK